MCQLDYRFIAIEKLRAQQEEIKAYDGWSSEDMLNHFIEDNGYHPVEQYQILKHRLMDEFLAKEDKEILARVKTLDLSEAIKLAEDTGFFNQTFNSFNPVLNKQIKNFLVKIFWEKDN